MTILSNWYGKCFERSNNVPAYIQNRLSIKPVKGGRYFSCVFEPSTSPIGVDLFGGKNEKTTACNFDRGSKIADNIVIFQKRKKRTYVIFLSITDQS